MAAGKVFVVKVLIDYGLYYPYNYHILFVSLPLSLHRSQVCLLQEQVCHGDEAANTAEGHISTLKEAQDKLLEELDATRARLRETSNMLTALQVPTFPLPLDRHACILGLPGQTLAGVSLKRDEISVGCVVIHQNPWDDGSPPDATCGLEEMAPAGLSSTDLGKPVVIVADIRFCRGYHCALTHDHDCEAV